MHFLVKVLAASVVRRSVDFVYYKVAHKHVKKAIKKQKKQSKKKLRRK